MSGFDDLAAQLEKLRQQGLYRSRRLLSTAQGADVRIDGAPKINFCSNDYLGLANHPKVIAAFHDAADYWGVGTGAAHLVCGHTSEHHLLEAELAAFTGRERALLFSTGYMANLGVISGLLNKGDAVFEDRLNHASLLDGGLISHAAFKRYLHADISSLKGLLSLEAKRKLIVTDGVFSMDGDVAPLDKLAALAKQENAWLMVDDAHGLGVLGAHGAGSIEYYALTPTEVPVLVGTLGKSFGTAGAFVAGSDALIETLIQSARTFVYTTAMPAAIAAATRASLKLVQQESWRRYKLKALIKIFRHGATELGLQLMPSFSPIQPILLGDARLAVKASERLFKQGFMVSAIRPPTVPKGTARLRVTLSALHTEIQVEALLMALAKALQ